MAQTPSLSVAIELLDENRTNELQATVNMLKKVLKNLLVNPTEEKFRTLKTSNPKFSGSIWSVRGGRPFMLSCGFQESGEEVKLPMDADLSLAQSGLAALDQLLKKRDDVEYQAKQELIAKRQKALKAEKADRDTMKMQIAGDAAARKEPGWTAKAAGVKGGKEVGTCGSIGAQGGGG